MLSKLSVKETLPLVSVALILSFSVLKRNPPLSFKILGDFTFFLIFKLIFFLGFPCIFMFVMKGVFFKEKIEV